MLGSLRKFSNSILAKIFLVIVAIPFIFWGMGDLFRGGNQNTIVKIEKEKVSTQEFVKYINAYASNGKTVDENIIDTLLSSFIGEKLIRKEIENFNINLSDKGLSRIIKNQKIFKKDNKFSRLEYEKFLIKNNLSAVAFEANILNQETRKQLLDFIGAGIKPSKFLVNIAFNKINQKRNIELIDLNELLKRKMNFTEEDIKSYFDQKKDNFKDIYKSVKFLEINPMNLTSNNEFNDLFYKKIDEIDDLVIEGKKLSFIIKKFNLGAPSESTFTINGKDKNLKAINNFPAGLVKNVFDVNEKDGAAFVEYQDKYYIFEILNTEEIFRNISDNSVRNKILLDLTQKTKRILISEFISKINKKNFSKDDFDKVSKDNNINIKKVNLKSVNDNEVLKQELLNQIYSFTEKSVVVVTDIGLTENYLIYVDKIENLSIEENSEDYAKYLNLSKVEITTSLFNTYDAYLKKKYNIDINYSALNNVKNYF